MEHKEIKYKVKKEKRMKKQIEKTYSNQKLLKKDAKKFNMNKIGTKPTENISKKIIKK